jgi:disulfide bond formation protein DsbB
MAAKQTGEGGSRGAGVPGFLVGTFAGLVALTGVSLILVPVTSLGIMHSLPSGAEPGSAGATAAATPAAPVAAVAAAAPSSSDAAALRMLPPGDAAQGEEQFATYCAACHGPDGKGRPNLGKDLVASTFVKGQNDTQLIQFIKKGRDVSDPLNTTKVPMPPKGGNPAFSDAELNDVVAYIRKLQKG